MSISVHQRPGVYSSYDASAVVSGRGSGRMVGLVGLNPQVPAGTVQVITSYDKAVAAFGSGASSLVPVALIIGLARGVNHVLTEGMISDTMLNAASNMVTGMSGPMFVICLLLIFFVLGFVVPSSSGLAVLSMPIFAPLADTVGIPRWIIVAAYQFGQYAMLYIAPTGLVMATLQMLDMKMSHWFKFVWPMMVFTLVFGAILLSVCSVVFAV